jgi:hypothetical protein
MQVPQVPRREWQSVHVLNAVDGCIPSDMSTGNARRCRLVNTNLSLVDARDASFESANMIYANCIVVDAVVCAVPPRRGVKWLPRMKRISALALFAAASASASAQWSMTLFGVLDANAGVIKNGATGSVQYLGGPTSR